MRADLQSKQSQLQVQMAVVKSQYQALTPGQREAMAAASACARHRPRRRHPRREDPAIVAAPPGGIPPGDVAPPEGAIAPEAQPAGEGIARGPGRADPHRLALLVGRIGTQRSSTARAW